MTEQMAAQVATTESETQLIERAQFAVSHCNWEVGLCASQWTRRFARGRTDADFAQLVGLSPDQTYQRRRVWEAFGDVHQQYKQLKWSHFYACVTWDDAADCLQWAEDIGATVAEMKAWRRAQRGEDLSQDSLDDSASWLTIESSEVRAPQSEGSVRTSEGGEVREREPAAPVAAGFARESSPTGDDYAPFSPDAVRPAQVPERSEPPARPSIEQLVRRLTTTMERCAAVIDDQFNEQFETVPEKDQRRFLKAMQALAEKVDAFR